MTPLFFRGPGGVHRVLRNASIRLFLLNLSARGTTVAGSRLPTLEDGQNRRGSRGLLALALRPKHQAVAQRSTGAGAQNNAKLAIHLLFHLDSRDRPRPHAGLPVHQEDFVPRLLPTDVSPSQQGARSLSATEPR